MLPLVLTSDQHRRLAASPPGSCSSARDLHALLGSLLFMCEIRPVKSYLTSLAPAVAESCRCLQTRRAVELQFQLALPSLDCCYTFWLYWKKSPSVCYITLQGLAVHV